VKLMIQGQFEYKRVILAQKEPFSQFCDLCGETFTKRSLYEKHRHNDLFKNGPESVDPEAR
jgi:hypothetical protein